MDLSEWFGNQQVALPSEPIEQNESPPQQMQQQMQPQVAQQSWDQSQYSNSGRQYENDWELAHLAQIAHENTQYGHPAQMYPEPRVFIGEDGRAYPLPEEVVMASTGYDEQFAAHNAGSCYSQSRQQQYYDQQQPFYGHQPAAYGTGFHFNAPQMAAVSQGWGPQWAQGPVYSDPLTAQHQAYDNNLLVQPQAYNNELPAQPSRQDDSRRTRSRSTRSPSPYSSPEVPRQSKRPSVFQQVYQPQKPKRDEKKPWVRTNGTTRGVTTRTAKINEYKADGYEDLPHPVGDWLSPATNYSFRYSKQGLLEKNTYPTKVIEDFIANYPRDLDTGAKLLTLFIQEAPADSARRYLNEDHSKCMFQDCPVQKYVNGKISHGHYRIAFDEYWASYGGRKDPVHASRYAHLYCMERFLDLEAICASGVVRVDTRSFDLEPKGKWSASLDGKAEFHIAASFVEACKRGDLRSLQEFSQYPIHRQHGRSKRYEHPLTLTHHMHHAKELSRPPAQITQLGVDRPLTGSCVVVHRGDLEMTLWKNKRYQAAFKKDIARRRKQGEAVNPNEQAERIAALIEERKKWVAEMIALRKTHPRKLRAPVDADDDEPVNKRHKRTKTTKTTKRCGRDDSEDESEDEGENGYGDDSDSDENLWDTQINCPIAQPVRKSARLQTAAPVVYNVDDSPVEEIPRPDLHAHVDGKYSAVNVSYNQQQYVPQPQYGWKQPALNSYYDEISPTTLQQGLKYPAQGSYFQDSDLYDPNFDDGLPTYPFEAPTPAPHQQEFLGRRSSSISMRPQSRTYAASKLPPRSSRYATRSSSRAWSPQVSPRTSVSFGGVQTRIYNPAESPRAGLQRSSLSSGAQSRRASKLQRRRG